MMSSWTRKPIVAGLGLAGTLFLSVAGCGGKGPEADNAVVVPDPTQQNVVTSSAPSAPASASPTAAAPAAGTPGAPAENVKAEGWGTLKGQITYASNPPEPKLLVEKGKAIKDPDVCGASEPIPSERLVVDPATKGVKNVLVFLRRPSAVKPEAKAAATVEIEFDQQNCTFKPHVLAAMAGAKIVMKNSDPKNHNVNSKLRNNPGNQNLPPSTTAAMPNLAAETTPGEVVCDIHPWMKSYWMVTDNPYYAVTDAKGNFEIKDVPAGTQKVVVWQESVTGGGFLTPSAGQSTTIKAGETATLDLKIDPGKVRPE